MNDHTDPDYTIAIFGDSFTAFNQQSTTWPHEFRKLLEETTRKRINVYNFARDGTGIIQMFRLAEDMIPLVIPDLVIIAYITDDINRAMFWRTETMIDGEKRQLTTIVPNRSPPLEVAVDGVLLHESATLEWCRSTLGKRDALVSEIEEKYRRIAADTYRSIHSPSILTLSHSYIYNRLLHSDPLHFFNRPSNGKKFKAVAINPRLSESDFHNVAGFVGSVEKVKSYGVPIKLVHLAIYPELEKGEEYLLNPQQSALLSSLHSIVDAESYLTLDHSAIPDDLEAIRLNLKNNHPSVIGMEYYAQAVAEMSRSNGWIATKE